jgi:2-polyprenyl-6-methoxyphenol hydroxylase-like FAD-dependent oxidoreductase
MTSKDHTPHVLILGGGIGGLTVAQALRKKGISFSIFERDPEQNSRNQGWSIGLHTILDDLKASIPDDMPSLETVFHLHPLKFPSQLAVYQAQDPSQRHGVTDDGAGKLLRANRRRLREFLSTGIQVEFAKQAAGIKEDDHSITVNFTDGTSANGDFLVGADGVNSIGKPHPHILGTNSQC